MRRYYEDDVAERDSESSRFHLAWLREVRGRRVLNLGCGPMLYDDIIYFGTLPAEVVGIDVNANNITFLQHGTHPALQRAKSFAARHRIATRLIVGDIVRFIPEFERFFDTVYALGVLGMFPRERALTLLRLVHDYLRPGGRFVDVDWTGHQLTKTRYRERKRYGWYSEDGTPSIDEIGSLLREAGFTVERHEARYLPKSYGWTKVYGYLALARKA